jgi:hypothetical protein
MYRHSLETVYRMVYKDNEGSCDSEMFHHKHTKDIDTKSPKSDIHKTTLHIVRQFIYIPPTTTQ